MTLASGIIVESKRVKDMIVPTVLVGGIRRIGIDKAVARDYVKIRRGWQEKRARVLFKSKVF